MSEPTRDDVEPRRPRAPRPFEDELLEKGTGCIRLRSWDPPVAHELTDRAVPEQPPEEPKRAAAA